jgi:thienamycin biosynthesis protein ThnO
MLHIPAIVNGRTYLSIDTQPIRGVDGAKLCELSLVPLVKIHESLRSAPGKLLELQKIPSSRIFDALSAVGRMLRGSDWTFAQLSKAEYCAVVARSTGLPVRSIAEDIDEIAAWLDQSARICAVQLPSGSTATLDAHRFAQREHEVGYFPAGSSLVVRVPGNIPSICTYWLQAVALKRPVIVVPPIEDPLTHAVLIDALRAAAPWLAACIDFVPCAESVFPRLLELCDQMVMSQSLARLLRHSADLVRKTFLIHYGRSKLLLYGQWTNESLAVAIRRMFWRHGRTCTGLTSVVTTHRGEEFCEQLAQRIVSELAHEGDELMQSQPSFSPQRARQLNALIDSLINRGAVDVTRNLDRRSRLVEHDGRAVLLPTVLWVPRPDSDAFGLELPFPFITVTQAADDEQLLRLARNTLILSTLGAGDELLQRFYFDSSIRKIFSGPHAERGYHFLDPHEGYMADFLYQKKAVLPACVAKPFMQQ